MTIAVRNVTSHVRVIERMTHPPGRCLNKSGRLPQTIFTTLSTAAAVPQYAYCEESVKTSTLVISVARYPERVETVWRRCGDRKEVY